MPLEVADDERILRGIFSPYHVSKGKLKPEAFKPPPGSRDVSVMRLDWLGLSACRDRVKGMDTRSGDKKYQGLAILRTSDARRQLVDVLDSRSVFWGHADIVWDVAMPGKRGEPLPPEQLHGIRARQKALVEASSFVQDLDPTSSISID